MSMDAEQQDSRSPLRFAEEVSKNFSFLIDYGFKIVESDPTFVRFESPSIIINVFHGRRSYEINLEVASTENPTDVYPFYYLLWAIDPNYKTRVYSAETAEDVAERVCQLAETIKSCIETGVLNDRDLFAKFDRQSKVWKHEFALKQNAEVAHRLWIKKEYQQVVRILARYKNELPPADLARLRDAEKHLEDNA